LALSPFAEPSRGGPRHSASPFAEPSRGGHNASPAGGLEPNTAWPPRPIPVDASSQPARRAASAPAQRSQPVDRGDAGRPDRLNVSLSRRQLWWLGGGIASASVAAILIALALPNPEARPPEASEAAGTSAVRATGSRRDSRSAQSVDRAAADLRERVRLARDAAAAGVPMTPPAVDRPTRPASATDLSAWLRSDDPGAVPMRPGKRRHKLVVDYTARPDEPAPPSLVAQGEEDPAIGMARNAYTTGNQRLFVGDLDGAVRAYREALETYPGYVGGYRGLGLVYEQLGDKASALAALHVYVAAVPNARDIVLIKKRIAHLQRR
jgi:Flp pilus assembly protein TadD